MTFNSCTVKDHMCALGGEPGNEADIPPSGTSLCRVAIIYLYVEWPTVVPLDQH